MDPATAAQKLSQWQQQQQQQQQFLPAHGRVLKMSDVLPDMLQLPPQSPGGGGPRGASSPRGQRGVKIASPEVILDDDNSAGGQFSPPSRYMSSPSGAAAAAFAAAAAGLPAPPRRAKSQRQGAHQNPLLHRREIQAARARKAAEEWAARQASALERKEAAEKARLLRVADSIEAKTGEQQTQYLDVDDEGGALAAPRRINTMGAAKASMTAEERARQQQEKQQQEKREAQIAFLRGARCRSFLTLLRLVKSCRHLRNVVIENRILKILRGEHARAANKIQRAFREFKVRELEARLHRAAAILKKYAWKARLNVHCRWRQRSAGLLRLFLQQYMAQGKLLIVIKQFKFGVTRCQSQSRDYTACRVARLVALNKLWEKMFEVESEKARDRSQTPQEKRAVAEMRAEMHNSLIRFSTSMKASNHQFTRLQRTKKRQTMVKQKLQADRQEILAKFNSAMAGGAGGSGGGAADGAEDSQEGDGGGGGGAVDGDVTSSGATAAAAAAAAAAAEGAAGATGAPPEGKDSTRGAGSDPSGATGSQPNAPHHEDGTRHRGSTHNHHHHHPSRHSTAGQHGGGHGSHQRSGRGNGPDRHGLARDRAAYAAIPQSRRDILEAVLKTARWRHQRTVLKEYLRMKEDGVAPQQEITKEDMLSLLSSFEGGKGGGGARGGKSGGRGGSDPHAQQNQFPPLPIFRLYTRLGQSTDLRATLRRGVFEEVERAVAHSQRRVSFVEPQARQYI